MAIVSGIEGDESGGQLMLTGYYLKKLKCNFIWFIFVKKL
jgi:hypothetical protein